MNEQMGFSQVKCPMFIQKVDLACLGHFLYFEIGQPTDHHQTDRLELSLVQIMMALM